MLLQLLQPYCKNAEGEYISSLSGQKISNSPGNLQPSAAVATDAEKGRGTTNSRSHWKTSKAFSSVQNQNHFSLGGQITMTGEQSLIKLLKSNPDSSDSISDRLFRTVNL